MNNLLTMFNYDFMVRAAVAGVAIAVSAGLIGLPLVLRRNAMIGDGLSHVGFAVFAVAAVLGIAPLQFAIPIVILTSFLMFKFSERARIGGDAIIALVSASALAVGVLVVSLGGVNMDINSYLFGSILAVSEADMIASLIATVVVIVFFVLCYHQIFAMSFDAKFASSVGVKTKYYELVFAVLCSVVIVLGMKIAGALLVSSLLVFPCVTARYAARSFREVTIMSAILAVVGFVIGLVLSYVLSVPTGATIVLTNLVMLIIFRFLKN